MRAHTQRGRQIEAGLYCEVTDIATALLKRPFGSKKNESEVGRVNQWVLDKCLAQVGPVGGFYFASEIRFAYKILVGGRVVVW